MENKITIIKLVKDIIIVVSFAIGADETIGVYSNSICLKKPKSNPYPSSDTQYLIPILSLSISISLFSKLDI
jgi:hypothetical protein